MPTTQMQPIHVFVPIERVDKEKRTVSAYAFRNEVVDGEGGVRLRRSAMEDATADYMQWANIRRMHQLDAVGVAESVVWDDKGALMTLRVVDDDAWNKVQEGVYKGLSVGVRPRVARGKEVTACTWFETSLVDRPKDTGCTIPLVRAEGVDPAAEVEVEQLEEEAETPAASPDVVVPEATTEEPAVEPEQRAETPGIVRCCDCGCPMPDMSIVPYGTAKPTEWQPQSFADRIQEQEGPLKGTLAWNALRSALFDIGYGNAGNKEELARAAIQQFADYVVPILAGAETERVERLFSPFTRAQDSTTVPSRENLEGGVKGDTHYSCGSEGYCHGHTTRGGAQECIEREAQGHEQHISMLEEHLAALKAKRRAEGGEDAVETPEVARTDAPPLPDATSAPANELLARVDTIPAAELTTFTTTILTRLEAAESGLATERQQHAVTKERAETLAKQPLVSPPVRFTGAFALARAFAGDERPETSTFKAEMQRAYDDGIAARDRGDEPAAARHADHYNRLKMQAEALS